MFCGGNLELTGMGYLASLDALKWKKRLSKWRRCITMDAGELVEIKRDIEEIKMQLAFLISRYIEEEEISDEEREEILEILNEVKRGEYVTKEEFSKELLGE